MPEPKIKPISMRANFIWTMLGNIVYSGSNWLTLVILAKLCALVLVGRYSLGLAVCAPIFAFADLRLRAIQSTDTKGEFDFSDYLMLRLITIAFSIMIVLALVFITDYHLLTKYVIVAVAFIYVFESLGDIHFGVFQFYESMDKIAVSMALKGIISIISLTVVVYFTRSVFYAALITAASYALIVFLYDIPNARYLMRIYQSESVYFAFNKKNIIKLAKTAFPLGVSTSINTFQSKVPTYFIMGAFGERQVGIFSTMIALIGLGDRIINALGQSAGPRLAKLFAANKTSDFRKLLMKLIFIGISLGVFGMLVSSLFGKQILTIVYSKEYSSQAYILVWLAAAAAVEYSFVFLGTAINSMRRFNFHLPISVAGVIVMLSLCYMLVGEYGVRGIIVAMFAYSLIKAFGCGWVVIKGIKNIHRIQKSSEVGNC